MGRLLCIGLAAAAAGACVGAVAGAALLGVAEPLPEHRVWFVGVCATLTALAAALIAVVASRRRSTDDGHGRRRLAGILLGACAGAHAARSLFGDHPAGKQFVCVAAGALAAAGLMALVRRLGRRPSEEQPLKASGRWFQFTLGSLFALTIITSVVLALWVRGPMARRRVLSAIEASGGGKVRYASRAPEWIVQLLGGAARGLFDEVDGIELYDPSDADLGRMAMFTRLRELQVGGNRIGDEGMNPIASIASLESLNLSLDVRGSRVLKPPPGSLAFAGTHITPDGLGQLRRLPHLKDLYLPESITDAGLNATAALTGLKNLYIIGHGRRPSVWPQITVSGMANLGRLTKLTELVVKKMPIGDDEVAFVEQLTQLKRLDLGQTNLTDRGLRHLRRLEQIELLELEYTLITGEGFAGFPPFAQLRQIELSGVPLTDDGLAAIAAFKSLISVTVHGADDVTDRGVAHLQSLTKLRSLWIVGTAVTDAGLKNLESLSSIQTFVCRGRNTTDAGIQALEEAWRRRRAAAKRD